MRINRLFKAACCGVVLANGLVYAQPVEPPNGLHETEVRTHALVDATVVIEPGKTIEHATILVKDGIIVDVGTDVSIPAGARVWPATGHTIYPGLIDPAVLVDSRTDLEPTGRHWNARIRPEVDLASGTGLDRLPESTRADLRSQGFTVVAVHPSKGILRGTGAIIPLSSGDTAMRQYPVQAPMSAGFDHGGSWENARYPGALMGAIALCRQTMLDAQWHRDSLEAWKRKPAGIEPPERHDAYEAMQPILAGEQVVYFQVDNELDAMRAARIADEFDLDLVLLGSGTEFRRLDEISSLDVPIIVPFEFPDRPDVANPARGSSVTLRSMQTWEQAPTNPRRLLGAGVDIAGTTHRLGRTSDLPEAVRKSMTAGLDEEEALACFTTRPARLLGIEQWTGTIEKGKHANFVVCDGPIFGEDTEVLDTWVGGRRHEIDAPPIVELAGEGSMEIDGRAFHAEVDTNRNRLSLDEGDVNTRAKKVSIRGNRITAVVDGTILGEEGWCRLGGIVEPDGMRGRVILPGGSTRAFTFTLDAPADPDETADAKRADEEVETFFGGEDDSISGRWDGELALEGIDTRPELELELRMTGEDVVTGEIKGGEQTIEIEEGHFDVSGNELRLIFESPEGRVVLTAVLEDDTLSGDIEGDEFNAGFTATRQQPGGERTNVVSSVPETMSLPLGAYGRHGLPGQEDVRINHATIWSCSDDGIIEDGCMVVKDGRITHVGPMPGPPPGKERVIDAGGRHVTPGLIDCHSHTGINGGVNEWTQTCTSEVSIGDVINPDDINWYRQLAGGLTAANQLHGSANPIGGQNSVVKLKWGGTADDMSVDDAIPGIKFALGENVKRSRDRYPNTRMGVETYIRDRFAAARAYREEWDRWESVGAYARTRMVPPRRDLELEALVEILEGERLIHCHSYRQDEILMLLRLAEEEGFTIGTLQHVLEGYKVAEVIAAHGAGASCFSDWWAYKVEVMDAIPYNGAIMHDVGVVVSFNSDSSEHARRMNDEAAKAVKYGGVDPHEALKFVTINPAQQLQIDHRTGSLTEGKDADFVIWSTSPLSSYSVCEQTWIEGARYFDLEEDLEARADIQRERNRLVQKILVDALGDPGGPRQHAAVPIDHAEPDDPRGCCGVPVHAGSHHEGEH